MSELSCGALVSGALVKRAPQKPLVDGVPSWWGSSRFESRTLTLTVSVRNSKVCVL